LVVAFALWFVYLLIATNFARLGILPMNIAVASLLFNLVEIPLAVLAGSRVYDSAKEKPAVSAKP
jgi:Zn-dependent membrane protease YugP